MSGDCCPTKELDGVLVQNNGIIRAPDGYLIGKLTEEIQFDSVHLDNVPRPPQWTYDTENVKGNLHQATMWIVEKHPEWDVVAMDHEHGAGITRHGIDFGNTIVVYRLPTPAIECDARFEVMHDDPEGGEPTEYYDYKQLLSRYPWLRNVGVHQVVFQSVCVETDYPSTITIKKIEKTYVVEQLMGNEWENCWHDGDELMTFVSREAAQTEIDEHIASMQVAVDAGHMDDVTPTDEYRISEEKHEEEERPEA